MTKSEVKWAETTRDSSVTVTAPAVRMVVLVWFTYIKDGELAGHCAVYPVVAIRSLIRRTYRKDYKVSDAYPDSAATEKQLVEYGWWLEGQETVTQALIVQDETHRLAAAEEFFDGMNCEYRLVCCPWDRDEDDERFADILSEMQPPVRTERKTGTRSEEADRLFEQQMRGEMADAADRAQVEFEERCERECPGSTIDSCECRHVSPN